MTSARSEGEQSLTLQRSLAQSARTRLSYQLWYITVDRQAFDHIWLFTGSVPWIFLLWCSSALQLHPLAGDASPHGQCRKRSTLFQLLGSFVSSMSRTSPVWGMRVEKPWLLATVFSVFSCLGDETHHESWITLSHCFSSIFYNPWENNGQGYTITIITAHVPGQHILSWQQSRPNLLSIHIIAWDIDWCWNFLFAQFLLSAHQAAHQPQERENWELEN